MHGGDLIVGKYSHRLKGIAQMSIRSRAVEHRVTDIGDTGPAAISATDGFFGGLAQDGDSVPDYPMPRNVVSARSTLTSVSDCIRPMVEPILLRDTVWVLSIMI